MQDKYTDTEVTISLMNNGYIPQSLNGFNEEELLNIIYKRYKGEINIVHRDRLSGFVAFYQEKEIFDSTNFNPACSREDALGSLLLILDKKDKGVQDL